MNEKYDILVLGAGFTGVAASVAAARDGAKVLLVEKSGSAGGAAVNCLVNPFMHYWIEKADENGNEVREDLNCGLFDEIRDGLSKYNAISSSGTLFCEEYLKIVFDEILKKYGVDVLYHTTLIGAQRDGKIIKSAELFCCGEKFSVNADYYIDCSGDANLSVLSGCPYKLGREDDGLCQPMTLCFRLINVDIQKFMENKAKINPLYTQMRESGKIKNPRENVLIFNQLQHGVLHFNTTRIVKKNPVDAWDLSFAEVESRKQILEIYNFLKCNIEGFENAELIVSAHEIGVRESRMIEGLHTINEEEILGCKKFDDSVARGNYCIDIHSPDGTGTIIKNIPKGDYYTIPYSSMLPKGVDNLIVAGRCISSTHVAQSAYRIMPICCSMGEGAGVAAALALKGNKKTRDIDICRLHELLTAYGAKY